MKRLVVITVTASAIIAGCSNAPPAAEDAFYHLPDATTSPGCDAQRALGPAMVAVPPLAAEGIYQQRAILFASDKQPTQLHQYHYHLWAAAPPLLLQQHAIDFWLRHGADNANLARRHDPSAASVIEGRILRFEQKLGARNEVSIKLELERRGAGVPRYVHVYEAVEPFTDASVSASVNAFGVAVDRILGQFCTDLMAATGPKQ